MKLHEPIGSSLFAPFFVRCAIGAYFVLAGLAKIDIIPQFIDQVKEFGILPSHLAVLYGILNPYTEIAVGVLLIVGFWTTLAGIISSLLLLSYIIALGTFPASSHVFNKDIVLLAGTLSLLFSGAGAFSIDRFRKTG